MIKALNDDELEETFARSSGPGGQNVNKTSTKVILKHLPTGIVVVVQDQRSQAQNRELARARLLEALQNREQERLQAIKDVREKQRRQTSPRPKKVKRQFVAAKRHRSLARQERTKTSDD